MKGTAEEFAESYDEWASEYDSENDFEERRALETLVVKHASPRPDDIVVDLGAGTGAIALALAANAGTVIGRDVSEGMLRRAREKAAARDIENVEFGTGWFRDPNVVNADIVVTNLALNHLGDGEKREAIETIAALKPRRIVFGEAMYLGERNPEDPLFNPDNVYPSTVGFLVDAVTGVGFVVTAMEKVHEEVGGAGGRASTNGLALVPAMKPAESGQIVEGDGQALLKSLVEETDDWSEQ